MYKIKINMFEKLTKIKSKLSGNCINKDLINQFLLITIISISFSCKNNNKTKLNLDTNKKIITVVDIAGRTVKVKAPVTRITLSESRYLYLIASLDTENPLKRIVSWNDDLPKYSPLTYSQYKDKFSDIDNITISHAGYGLTEMENTIEKKPDLVIFSLSSKIKIDETKYIEKLEKAGIPSIFIDMRQDPIKNTNSSIKLLGKLFGKEERAEEIIDFRKKALKKVTDIIEKHNPKKPKVFIEKAAGYNPDGCCGTFSNSNFGDFITIAGGENIAHKFIPGASGKLNPEQVIVSNPDKILLTGANWKASAPEGKWVPLGPGSDKQEIEERLQWFYNRDVYKNTTAAKNNDIHAIWHQFYNSPYEFIAIQKLAKWFHPELFKDLDPDATFKEFHNKFLPVEYKSGYWSE